MVLFKLKSVKIPKSSPLVFTFQYGSIQILKAEVPIPSLLYLHSNMVLFKWTSSKMQNSCKYIYIPIWFYSNIESPLKDDLTSKFTFQYGSIQIGILWTGLSKHTKFTFQYGSIQIKTFTIMTWLQKYLHSNMVLFKF